MLSITRTKMLIDNYSTVSIAITLKNTLLVFLFVSIMFSFSTNSWGKKRVDQNCKQAKQSLRKRKFDGSDNHETHNDFNGKKIGKITFCVYDVFDTTQPDQKGILYRTANALHIKTKKKYIREQILFSEGETINHREIDETERIIRQNNYIRDANILLRANAENDDLADALVTTNDSWTTKPTLSYKRTGGVTTSSFGLREDNLLGQGIRLSFKRKNDIERDSNEFRYSDLTAFGFNKSLFVDYSNNSDGFIKAVQLEDPFISLNDNHRYGFSYKQEIKENQFFSLGEEIFDFQSDVTSIDIYYGYSKGFYEERTIRHQFGLESYQTLISQLSNTDNTGDNNLNGINFVGPASLNLLDESHQSPYYDFQLIQDHFKKVYDRRAINRPEDRNYGFDLQLRFGFPTKFSESDNSVAFQKLYMSKAFELNDSSEIAIKTSLELQQFEDFENEAIANYEMEYFKAQTERLTLYSNLRLNHGHNLANGKQIVLDNLNGLRGYPVNHLTGTRSALFSLEERVYFNRALWELINAGAAIFFDIGQIDGEEALDDLDVDYFRSIGIGLRLSSSRSSDNSVLHIDFAKPLDAHTGSRSYQFAIELKNKF